MYYVYLSIFLFRKIEEKNELSSEFKILNRS